VKRKVIYIDNFLTQHGHTPTIGESIATLLAGEGYEIIKASSKKNKLPRLLDMLKTIYRHKGNAVVLISTYSGEAFYFALVCSWLCRMLNLKYIPCLHGGNLPKRISISKSMSRQLFGKSYMNVAVSGYLEQYIKQNGWKVVVIPNIIHIKEYPYQQRLECTGKILWVRSFHEIYNPSLAIKMMAQLSKANNQVKLAMVGPDKDGSLNTCKQLATELGVADRIEFLGLLSREEWTKLSAGYDVFINTTNFDNLPVSIIEAMALGMPIVSTNVGGLKFLIEHNRNGLLVNPNSEEAFVGAIKTLINNNELVQSLSINAREFAVKFDWDHVKHQWNDLLLNA
jgi:glycosyltransferase involved in cell wall biosynthesis